MRYSIAASGLLAAGALAHPLTTRQSANIDATILQFALTLEHLENAFYHGALSTFSLQDFEDAGYSATYYNNLNYISYDEQSHVSLLSGALTAAGVTPVQACQYSFPYTDVNSFITLSSVLEGVGTSAYLAGAPLITSKQYLTVAGSILVAEALHTSMQRGAIGEVPMANPYGTPLDPMAVYTLAAMFITSCPATNAALPFTAFPTLTYAPNPACYCEGPDCSSAQVTKRDDDSDWESWNDDESTAPASDDSSEDCDSSDSTAPGYMGDAPVVLSCAPPSVGASITLTAASAIPAGSFVTFISGLAVVSVQGTISGNSVTVAIPSIAAGQTYVFVSSSDVEGALVDTAVLFGPAIVEVNPASPVIDYSIM